MKKRPSKLSDWVSKCGYSLSLTSTQTFFLGRHFCPSYKTHNLTHTFTYAHTLRHSHLLTNPLSHHSRMHTLITHTHTHSHKYTNAHTLRHSHLLTNPLSQHSHMYTLITNTHTNLVARTHAKIALVKDSFFLLNTFLF